MEDETSEESLVVDNTDNNYEEKDVNEYQLPNDEKEVGNDDKTSHFQTIPTISSNEERNKVEGEDSVKEVKRVSYASNFKLQS